MWKGFSGGPVAARYGIGLDEIGPDVTLPSKGCQGGLPGRIGARCGAGGHSPATPADGKDPKMKAKSLYEQGHLVVAAIRVLEHQRKVPPSVEDICSCLSLSTEQGHRICSRLQEQMVVEVVRGAYGTKVFLRNHHLLEELPKTEDASGIADEVKKFQESRKGMDERIAAFKAQQEEKKKNLFADLDKKLKKSDP
jgi:hypothetical protein